MSGVCTPSFRTALHSYGREQLCVRVLRRRGRWREWGRGGRRRRGQQPLEVEEEEKGSNVTPDALAVLGHGRTRKDAPVCTTCPSQSSLSPAHPSPARSISILWTELTASQRYWTRRRQISPRRAQRPCRRARTIQDACADPTHRRPSCISPRHLL